MDFIQVMLVIGAVAGLILIFVSFTGHKTEASPARESVQGGFIAERLEAMGSTISEADNVMTELGGMSQTVMKEMDQKYNELLYLYNLIDEKIRDADDKIDLAAVTPVPPIKPAEPAQPHSEAYNTLASNPRFTRIMELKARGMNIAQIAKELDMGQGEVSLIMSLTGK